MFTAAGGTSDVTPPTVTAFTIPATASTLTVPIPGFTATDNVGVTGYLVKESAPRHRLTAGDGRPTAPTAYTFATGGSKTLYAWAKDAAGTCPRGKTPPFDHAPGVWTGAGGLVCG